MSAMMRLIVGIALVLAGRAVQAAPGPTVRAVNGRVTGRFVEAPLASAVRQLAASLGAQVEWHGPVDGSTVSTELSDVSVDEALERVLSPHSYFVVAAGSGKIRRIVVMMQGDGTVTMIPDASVGNIPWSAEGPGLSGGIDAPGVSVSSRLADPDPAVRRGVLDQARDFDPSDPRRDMVQSALGSDSNEAIRRDARALTEATRSGSSGNAASACPGQP